MKQMEEIKHIAQLVQNQFKGTDKTFIEPTFKHEDVVGEFIKRLSVRVHQVSFGKKSFVVDDENAVVIDLMCRYMNNDVTFEKSVDKEGINYSLNKGLFLYGNYGSGKSLFLETFAEMNRDVFKKKISFNTCQDMNEKFLRIDTMTSKIDGIEGIRYAAKRDDQVERIFDDLGSEETTIQNYGNKFCVMAYIFNERHKGLICGTKTHATSNLSKKQIGEEYGGRIESRFFEMFNMIVLGQSRTESIDYRKK